MTGVSATVIHRCKHSVVHDFSAVAAYDRAGRAKFLASKPCRACWIATQQKRRTTLWLKAKNAAELETAAARAARLGLPVLHGSEKAVGFAMRVRQQLLDDAHQAFSDHPETFTELFLAPARRIGTASWWIDQKSADPSMLAGELLLAVGLLEGDPE